MTDGTIQVLPDSTGKIIDTTEIAVGANTVERQRVILADSDAAGGVAAISGEDQRGVVNVTSREILIAMNRIAETLERIEENLVEFIND